MATTAKLTLDEYLTLPETKPYSEYVDGEVVQKPMPTLAHSIIQALLASAFDAYFRVNPIGIVATELRCILGPGGHELARLPDVVVILTSRVKGAVGNGPFYGAPDLAVEILSPDDRMLDVLSKVMFYLASGVRIVWVINPVGRTVIVSTSPSEFRVLDEDAKLEGDGVLPGFSARVREILPPPDLLVEA